MCFSLNLSILWFLTFLFLGMFYLSGGKTDFWRVIIHHIDNGSQIPIPSPITLVESGLGSVRFIMGSQDHIQSSLRDLIWSYSGHMLSLGMLWEQILPKATWMCRKDDFQKRNLSVVPRDKINGCKADKCFQYLEGLSEGPWLCVEARRAVSMSTVFTLMRKTITLVSSMDWEAICSKFPNLTLITV